MTCTTPVCILLRVGSMSWLRRFLLTGLFAVCCTSISAGSISASTNGILTDLRGEIASGGVYSGAVGAGYSIAGVLDIGLLLRYGTGSDDGSTQSDLGFSYAVTPLKQVNGAPVSLRAYGSYTHSSEHSQFLTDNRLIRDARGYSVGVVIARDLHLGTSVALRIALLGEYENYTEETVVGFDAGSFTGPADVDYDEFPSSRLLSQLIYGGSFSLVLISERESFVSLGADLLLNTSFEITVRPAVQLFFGTR